MHSREEAAMHFLQHHLQWSTSSRESLAEIQRGGGGEKERELGRKIKCLDRIRKRLDVWVK